MNRALSLPIALTFLGAVSSLVADPRPLTVEEARELAHAALPSLALRLPGLYLDSFSVPFYAEFYFFEIQWNSTGDISPIVDHYAVDSKSGDVWNAVVCRELKTSELKKRQALLRKKIGLTHAQYGKIRRLGPECE